VITCSVIGSIYMWNHRGDRAAMMWRIGVMGIDGGIHGPYRSKGPKPGAISGATCPSRRTTSVLLAFMDGVTSDTVKRRAVSCLGHDILSPPNLTLDLFTCPTCGLDGSCLEVAVGLCLLDHCGQPVLTEGINKLAIGVGFGQVTKTTISNVRKRKSEQTYPMTPMEARMRDSLRFMSLAMAPRSEKIKGTYCCRTWAKMQVSKLHTPYQKF
jgi:hypothetical protein